MALVHTIPETDATIPPALRAAGNGALPADWLRSFDGTTRSDYKLYAPVSYAMQALHIAALADGIRFATTGRYRPYAQQLSLFRSRFTVGPYNPAIHRSTPSIVQRTFEGKYWYLLKGMAMAATPGTSNHGWAIADDIAELDANGRVISLTQRGLQWLKDHARSFGFALDIHEEPWHWHWYNGSALTQRTVEVLAFVGAPVPSLAAFGFVVPGLPAPQPPAPPPPAQEVDVNWNQPDNVLASVVSAPPTAEVLAGRANDWAVIALIKSCQKSWGLPITGRWNQAFGERFNREFGYKG